MRSNPQLNNKKSKFNNFATTLTSKDIKLMSQWVMRQWFDPKKDSHQDWYDASITEDNVMSYLETRPGGFRLSVPQLKSFWYSIRVLQRRMSLPQMDADLEALEKELGLTTTLTKTPVANDNATKSGYTSGEVPLFEVGNVFGMSAAAIGVIAQQATSKLGTLTKGVHPTALTHDNIESLEEHLEDSLKTASGLFASLLASSGEDTDDFLFKLLKLHVLTKKEVQAVETVEVEALKRLSCLPKECIEEVVQEDLHNVEGNVIKTFQSLYSRCVYHRESLEAKLDGKLTRIQGKRYAA